VRIDDEALEGLDPGPAPDAAAHLPDGDPAEVAAHVLVLDAIAFGSGWFPTLRKRRDPGGRPLSGTFTVARALEERFRAAGPWSNDELRAMRTEEVADVLGQPRDHELMALYAQALRELGAFLGERHALDLVSDAGGSAVRLAELVSGGMTTWRDPGFHKRAQLLGSDLALAGVADLHDLDALTIFADNLVPHVLRCEGVLVLEERLAAHIDAGRLLRAGPQERELRAAAVHACTALARRTGRSERDLDAALWHRGQRPEYKARPRPRCRTVAY
jgi:Potential Queuosine, Q, salvage protein family